MYEEQVVNELKEIGINAEIQRNQRVVAKVEKEKLIEVCNFIREKGFAHCSCVAGVDYLQYFQIVYSFYDLNRKVVLLLEVDLDKKDAKIQSVANIWGGANWHERETAELFGIEFLNHPNLEHLLLQEGWEIHPLRKDFKLDNIRGLPIRRKEG